MLASPVSPTACPPTRFNCSLSTQTTSSAPTIKHKRRAGSPSRGPFLLPAKQAVVRATCDECDDGRVDAGVQRAAAAAAAPGKAAVLRV